MRSQPYHHLGERIKVGNSKCKGPEVKRNLACWSNWKKAHWLELREQREMEGDKVEDIG